VEKYYTAGQATDNNMAHAHCMLGAFFVGKKYGCSKGYRQRNAAHMGSISLWISPALNPGPLYL
jgi:hypothetical protein